MNSMLITTAEYTEDLTKRSTAYEYTKTAYPLEC